MKNRINERNGLQEIIDKALDEMAQNAGGSLELADVNLAEFQRITGLSRSKARTIKAHGFKAVEHGRCGRKAASTVLDGYTETIDDLLRRGVTNASVLFDRVSELGYRGSLSSVKRYARAHAGLVPAKRRIAAPQPNRGRRFQTDPGEAYQMDWGFVNAVSSEGDAQRIACFAMVCHHCGTCYIEFFPNAKQENLFIGMAHAFMVMGVPQLVLTDNMTSVVIRRDVEGRPVWNLEYASFMGCVGFKTKLCKPRHPFTKGKVERLVRFVKENFLAGRAFRDLTDLNSQALMWCGSQSSRYRRALGCVPADEHAGRCLPAARPVELDDELAMYLCPKRKISFDGFVSYEGRRFGVPYWYPGRECRVNRDGCF